jgi:hypothetical protein
VAVEVEAAEAEVGVDEVEAAGANFFSM